MRRRGPAPDRLGTDAVDAIFGQVLQRGLRLGIAQGAQSGNGGQPHLKVGISQRLAEELSGLGMALGNEGLQGRRPYAPVAVAAKVGRFGREPAAAAGRPGVQGFHQHRRRRVAQGGGQAGFVGGIEVPGQAADQLDVQLGDVRGNGSRAAACGRRLANAVLIGQFAQQRQHFGPAEACQGLDGRRAHGEPQFGRPHRGGQPLGPAGVAEAGQADSGVSGHHGVLVGQQRPQVDAPLGRPP